MIPYHIEHFADSLTAQPSEEKEKEYLKLWKRPFASVIKLEHDCTIVDQGGKILVWILPTLFSPKFQARSDMMIWLDDRLIGLQTQIFEATSHLLPDMETNAKKPPRSTSWNWRLDPNNFRCDNELNQVRPPGVTSFSPAWYTMGHENEVRSTGRPYYARGCH